jgi:hypothetical protein
MPGENHQMTARLALAIIAVTIGGSLTFGYHLACLNAPVNVNVFPHNSTNLAFFMPN